MPYQHADGISDHPFLLEKDGQIGLKKGNINRG